MAKKQIIILHKLLDNNKWWVKEEDGWWVLFIRHKGKVWKSAMKKTELDMIMDMGELEDCPDTAKKTIALTMVYHIEAQMKKADEDIR